MSECSHQCGKGNGVPKAVAEDLARRASELLTMLEELGKRLVEGCVQVAEAGECAQTAVPTSTPTEVDAETQSAQAHGFPGGGAAYAAHVAAEKEYCQRETLRKRDTFAQIHGFPNAAAMDKADAQEKMETQAEAIMAHLDGDIVANLAMTEVGTVTPVWQLGKCYVIRTTTVANMGRLIAIGEHELVLDQASWIDNPGRYWATLHTGSCEGWRPYPRGKSIIIGRRTVTDAAEIDGTIQVTQ
jgi:hypothetical protein